MKNCSLLGVCVIAALGAGPLAAAPIETNDPPDLNQPQAITQDDLLRELRSMRERIESLERQHAEDQRRLRVLEEDRKTHGAPAKAASSPPTIPPTSPPTSPPANQAASRSAQAPRGNAVQPARAGSGGASSLAFSSTAVPGLSNALGQGNLYNPAITIFGDLGASLSTNGDDNRFNRFNLREFEFDARAAISPFADGVFIATFGEEIEDAPGGGVDIATVVDVEEGYINFHSLPYDLTAKVGKFRNAFGPSNTLHTHDTPQVTRPLATQAFLGPEGMSTLGISASWIVPNPWDEFIELTGEVVNADGGQESPILGGPNAKNPAYLGHLKWFTDVSDFGSLELGGSYLYAHTAADAKFDANVFGLDATLKLPDPEAPDLRSFLLQGELFYSQNDILDQVTNTGTRNNSIGAYAFAQWQLSKNWYTGVRGDITEFPNSDTRGPSDRDWAVSPYVTWYLSEFLRLRFEYQHREFETGGSWDNEDNLFIQLTFVLGAHPPHPYWVNR